MGRLGAHANLVTVHDVGEENGQPYIVEEYIGRGLSHRCRPRS